MEIGTSDRSRVSKTVGAAIATGASLAVYLLYVRPRHIRWGATDEEVEHPMPGDEVVERPNFVATRAVTIEATSEEVWPWLVQIGSGRAGFYSYDWIDNAGRPSAREIISEYQHIEVGDLVPMLPGAEVGMWVKGFEANSWMLWWDRKGEATWAWGLYPQGEGRTRLISRLRVRYAWTSPMIIYFFSTEAGAMSHLPAAVLGLALCDALILFIIRRMRARASYGRPRLGEHHG
jgi:hypothetical protein